MKHKVYIAGGWFSSTQELALCVIEDLMRSQDKYDFFAPRLHNKGEEGKTDWDKIFKRNIDELSECQYMIASTAGKDMGTLVEVGMFLQMKKPVIFFCLGLKGDFNLMLAKAAHRVCVSKKELTDAIFDLAVKKKYRGSIE